MMNRIVFVISFIWIAFVASAQNASEILDKAAQVYEQSQGIKANFSLHTSIPQQGVSESFEGTIQMRGDKFKLETPDMITWYDGSTQWAYVLRTEEVNVSTPGGDELQVTNPAVLLRSYKKGFKVAYRGTSTTRQAKSAYDIVLTPKGKSDGGYAVADFRSVQKELGTMEDLRALAENGFKYISPVEPFIAILSPFLNILVASSTLVIAGIACVLAIIEVCEFVPPISEIIPDTFLKSSLAVSDVVSSVATIIVFSGNLLILIVSSFANFARTLFFISAISLALPAIYSSSILSKS